MENLDQTQIYNEIDKDNMLKNIEELPDQIEKAWEELQSFVIPTPYIKVKNVVVVGMGGSGIGGSLTKCLAYLSSKVPIETVKDYSLPNYVNSETLVIAVSYSGETEETLATFKEAGKKQAKLIAVTTGGELASIASRFKAPVYRINYGSQPRAALGYEFTAVLAIFNKLGFIELGKEEIKETVILMKGLRTKLSPDVPTYQNDAKKMALRLENVIPLIVGSGFLVPVAYRWATQVNENAKHLASAFALPEICHNWLTGLQFPLDFRKSILVIIIQSKYDHPRNRVRQNIISQILRKLGINHEFVFVQPSGSALSEQLLTIYLGDYISYYLAILHKVNPNVVEEVDYLKKNLENSSAEF